MRATRISIESILLIFICLADMVSTLLLVSAGTAVEQNPLMAACLRHSTITFVFVKLLSFIPFIALNEWYRRRNPMFAQGAARTAIVLYVLVYAFFTAQTNIV